MPSDDDRKGRKGARYRRMAHRADRDPAFKALLTELADVLRLAVERARDKWGDAVKAIRRDDDLN